MAYQLLKEAQKEIYSEANIVESGDLESAPDLNHCRDSLSQLLNGFLSQDGGVKRPDKVTKAQEIVDQAKRLMGDNVKKMIDNQKDFNVSIPSFT